MPDKGKLNRNI